MGLISRFSGNFLVHNYFPIPQEQFVLNLASLNERIRQKSVSHVFKAINFCNKTGAKLYTFHPGFLVDPQKSAPGTTNYDFDFRAKPVALYEQAFQKMLLSLKEIVAHARKKKVKIALETEGSLSQKDYLLMQRPEEFNRFFSIFSPQDLGISLNLGHLNLASQAFDFDREQFVGLISEYVVALEMSHNEGINDDHLLLKNGAWYWEIIFNPKFFSVYKILETRNTDINQIKDNLDLIRSLLIRFCSSVSANL